MSVKIDAQKRPLSNIAEDIYESWGAKVSPHAKPYLDAMLEMNLITDNFHEDTGEYVVRYLLENTGGWRGEKAREIKAELRAMLS